MKTFLKYSIPFFLLSIVLCSFSFIGNSKGWETAEKTEVVKVYEKAMEWYSKNENGKVNIRYSSFTDHTSAKAYEESNGYFKKDKNNIHSSVLGITTIQNEKICFVVDSVNQIIVLKRKADINQPLFDLKTFSESLDRVKGMKKQIIENKNTLYRIEYYANSIYEASEFNVNDKGLITVVKYFYNKEVQEDLDDPKSIKGKPRLEISFSGYQTGVSFNYEKDFSEKKYLKDIGKHPVLNEAYKKFQLKDYRFEE